MTSRKRAASYTALGDASGIEYAKICEIFRTRKATLLIKSDWLTVVGIGGHSIFGPYIHGSVRTQDPELGPKARPDHARFLAVRNIPE
jgi:hypothetical protein